MKYACCVLFGALIYSCTTPAPPVAKPNCRCAINTDPCDCPTLPASVDLGCTKTVTISREYTETIVITTREIRSNGIPNHTVGEFPLTTGSGELDCCIGRPTAIGAVSQFFQMPAQSQTERKDPVEIRNLPLPIPGSFVPNTDFGIAFSGIPFDPAAAEWWESPAGVLWALNAIEHPEMAYNTDCNHAHVQPDGAYHYHGFPQGYYDQIQDLYESGKDMNGTTNTAYIERSDIVQLGWAVDGNPIYGEKCGKTNASEVTPASSYELQSSSTVRGCSDCPPSFFALGAFINDYKYTDGLGDLDECNGHYGVTPEFAGGVYHYHITKTYPYIGRCVMKF